MSESRSLSEIVLALARAQTNDLRTLARIAGGDPSTFYIGTPLLDADLRGQDLRGMETLVDLDVKIDERTRFNIDREIEIIVIGNDNYSSDEVANRVAPIISMEAFRLPRASFDAPHAAAIATKDVFFRNQGDELLNLTFLELRLGSSTEEFFSQIEITRSEVGGLRIFFSHEEVRHSWYLSCVLHILMAVRLFREHEADRLFALSQDSASPED